MARLLDSQIKAARISEYESGTREPNLITLLAYARVAEIPLEYIVDDALDLNRRTQALHFRVVDSRFTT